MFELKACKNSNNELRVTLLPIRIRGESLRSKAAASLAVPESEVEAYSRVKAGEPSLLDFRCEFKTKKIDCSAHSHRRTRFGRYAKTRIIRAAGALDQLDPEPSSYLFLTATLPSNDEWAKWAIAEDSGNLINGFKAWLSKRVRSRHEFYVWEHQNREALHFHYCIHVPDVEAREGIARDFRAEWMRLLDGMTQRTGVCAWGRHAGLSYEDRYAILQTRAETVHSSVSQYMAGYCGGKKDKHAKDSDIPYYPKRWFGVSRCLSSLVGEYTEGDSTIYGSYRAAKIAFDELHEEFNADSIDSKKFAHKIGVGETSVNYHTPKNLQRLWQSRKTMKYSKRTHPNISFWIQTALSAHVMISQLSERSQQFREQCSKLAIDTLRDGLYEGSLRRGSLNERQVEAIEILWSNLASQWSLPPSQKPLLTALTRFVLMRSRHWSRIGWNRYGWLDVVEDFPDTVDKSSLIEEDRTRPADEGTASSLEDSRGHVPSERKFEPSQLSLL